MRVWANERSDANIELFLDLGAAGKATLRARGFGFYDWGAATGPEARFVVSWDQTEASVEALCAALQFT